MDNVEKMKRNFHACHDINSTNKRLTNLGFQNRKLPNCNDPGVPDLFTAN